jgi:hypothetical protein
MWGEKRPTSLGRLSLEPPALAVSRYKPIGFASRALQRSPRHLRPSTAIRARTSRLPGPHVHSWPMFLVLGIGTEVGALLALLAFYARLVHRPGKIEEMRARFSQRRLTSQRRLRR